jgi:hypothetical protein
MRGVDQEAGYRFSGEAGVRFPCVYRRFRLPGGHDTFERRGRNAGDFHLNPVDIV